jgi:hypothetical protein
MPKFGDDQATGDDQVHEIKLLIELIAATSRSSQALTVDEIDQILGLNGTGGAGADVATGPTDDGFGLEFVGTTRMPEQQLTA